MRRSSLLAAKKAAWRFTQPLSDDLPCKVLFAGPHFHAGLPTTKQVLSERGHASSSRIELHHAPTPEDMRRLAPSCHVAIPFMERFPQDFLEQSSKLRLVVQYGVGLEGVDVEAATRLRIAVSNMPADASGNAEATSEMAIYLSMSLLRYNNVSSSDSDLPRRFQAQQLGGLPIPRTLYQKRVTVVGFGAVGQVLTRYLLAMGAQVQVVRKQKWSTTTDDDDDDNNGDYYKNMIKAKSLEAALPTTDLLILACIMTPETFHLLNDTTISLLPRGALVVNVGRGPLVEHGAILRALQLGHVGGFASDVGVGHPTKPSEPWDPQDELSLLENTLFTPHVAGYSDYSYTIMANKIVDAIESVMAGSPPPVWVNRDN